MIYLDTHVVVWLYAGKLEKLSEPAKELINDNDIMISPVVCLELQYLFEIQRISDEAKTIVADLSDRIGLYVCDKDFNSVINSALDFSWTRDPFDRIIVATAAINSDILVSQDRNILANYQNARW